MIQGARHSLCSERTRYLATHVLIQRNQVFVIWVDLRKSCCVCCRNICPVCRSVGLPIPLLHVDDDDGRSGWVAKSTVLYTDPQSIYTKFFVNDNNGSMVHVECELSTLTPEMKSLAHASHVDNCTLVVRENIVVKVVKPPQEIVHQTDSNDHAADFQVVNESTDHVTDHCIGRAVPHHSYVSSTTAGQVAIHNARRHVTAANPTLPPNEDNYARCTCSSRQIKISPCLSPKPTSHRDLRLRRLRHANSNPIVLDIRKERASKHLDINKRERWRWR